MGNYNDPHNGISFHTNIMQHIFVAQNNLLSKKCVVINLVIYIQFQLNAHKAQYIFFKNNLIRYNQLLKGQ